MKLLRYTTYLIIYIHTIILYFWMMISANGGGCYTFSLGRKQIFDEAGADFGAEGRGVDGDARVTQGVEVPDLSFRVHQQLQWRFGTVLHLLPSHVGYFEAHSRIFVGLQFLFTCFVDPFRGAIATFDVHGLALGEAVGVCAERVRYLTRQFHLFLHGRVRRRVEARRRVHPTSPRCQITRILRRSEDLLQVDGLSSFGTDGISFKIEVVGRQGNGSHFFGCHWRRRALSSCHLGALKHQRGQVIFAFIAALLHLFIEIAFHFSVDLGDDLVQCRFDILLGDFFIGRVSHHFISGYFRSSDGSGGSGR